MIVISPPLFRIYFTISSQSFTEDYFAISIAIFTSFLIATQKNKAAQNSDK